MVEAQFNYITNADGISITITAYSGNASSVSVPDSINGLLVTSIGTNAFSNNTFPTSITIPNSVTNIGDYAFYDCYGLTNITMGDSITIIGANAFGYSVNLTGVVIPNSVIYRHDPVQFA